MANQGALQKRGVMCVLDPMFYHTRDYATATCAQLMAQEDEGWTYLPSPLDPTDPNSLYRIVVLDDEFNKMGTL
tara:strand:+ start:59 stop:280 length:222 start_codon:yes stop_codon:yes gene_type:complete